MYLQYEYVTIPHLVTVTVTEVLGNNTLRVTSTSDPNIFPLDPVSRRFVFTLNNPDGLITELDFANLGARYMVFQLEMGEENHTVHYQGYLEFPKAVRRSHVAKVLDRANIDVARGTPQQCEDYCTKEETRLEDPIRYGTPGGKQGKRSDVLALRDAVKSGKRGRELFDDDLTAGPAIRYCRGVAELGRAYNEAAERTDLRVIFHYGPAGTGKTHCAHHPGAYYFDGNSGEFWVGYSGQDTVILDEFGGHVLKPLFLQRLCDKYPLWLPIKGSETPCNVCCRPAHADLFLFSNIILDSYRPYLFQLSSVGMVECTDQVQ